MAQQCLSVPSTWPFIDENTITDPNDPLYLGAWWLGFLPITLMVSLPGIFIFFFPKHWPSDHEERGKVEGEDNKDMPHTAITSDEKDGRGRGRMGRNREKSDKTENPHGDETVDIASRPSLLTRIVRSVLGIGDCYLCTYYFTYYYIYFMYYVYYFIIYSYIFEHSTRIIQLKM